MAKSPEEMAAAMLANLPDKTGKTLDEWFAVLDAASLAKHGQMVGLLKKDHGVTHGFANLIAHQYRDRGSASAGKADDPVAAQYAGPKAALRPIYDALIAAVTGFGKDVEVAPKKSYVSLRRNKQFALIQPSTKTRVDVGINLKGTPPTDRLEASGSFNAMVSHRVRLTDAAEVDAELTGWLKSAYEAA